MSDFCTNHDPLLSTWVLAHMAGDESSVSAALTRMSHISSLTNYYEQKNITSSSNNLSASVSQGRRITECRHVANTYRYVQP